MHEQLLAKGKAVEDSGSPQKKVFVSNHPDDALKEATFETGKLIDATQFVKSIETLAMFVGLSGREHADQLQLVLNGDIAVLPIPTIPMPTRPTPEVIAADDLERSIYLDGRRTALKQQVKLSNELGQ